MQPRIVREIGGAIPFAMHELGTGFPYLALPWPESCPYTPEQVMAACERHGRTLTGVPETENCSSAWLVFTMLAGENVSTWVLLTPKFIGEPKCDWCQGGSAEGDIFVRCSKCGATVHDRRHGERRKGERRKIGPRYEGGRKRQSGQRERRTGKDRRTP